MGTQSWVWELRLDPNETTEIHFRYINKTPISRRGRARMSSLSCHDLPGLSLSSQRYIETNPILKCLWRWMAVPCKDHIDTVYKLSCITPACQHKTGSAVKSVEFCTCPRLQPRSSLTVSLRAGKKKRKTLPGFVWSAHVQVFSITLSISTSFKSRECLPLGTPHHFPPPSPLISPPPLPLSTSICPRLIIPPSSLSLHVSPSLARARLWLSGVAVRALWWPPPAWKRMDHMASVCRSVRVCWSVPQGGDGDVMEIKDFDWERFKPIYCGSLHNSRSRGKP